MNISKQKWKRIIVLFSVMLLVAGIVLAVVLSANSSDSGENFSATNEADSAQDLSQLFTVHNSEYMMMSAKAAPMSAVNSAKTVQLTATLLPETTQDKTVDWTVAFVNPDSAWAKGKNASEYVSVIPTSDGALTANVSALKGFSEQVKITVTSRVNENATAYCVADYGKRLSDTAIITFENEIISPEKRISTGGIQTVESIRAMNWQGLMAMFNAHISYSPSYNAEYTKNTASENITMSVRPTEEFYNSLKAKGLGKTSNDWTAVDEDGACGLLYDGLCSVNIVPRNGLPEAYERINKFNEAVLATTADHDFEIKIVVTTDFETKEYLIPCKFNRNGAAFTATSAKLNQESIVL